MRVRDGAILPAWYAGKPRTFRFADDGAGTPNNPRLALVH
jgi:hypothetical protein